MVLLKISNISGILKMGCTMKGPTAETNDRKKKQEVFLRLNHHELQRIPAALIYEFL